MAFNRSSPPAPFLSMLTPHVLACVLTVAVLLCGCHQAVTPKQLTVQAFIVTKSLENLRLGLVPIHAAPTDVVRSSIRLHQENVTHFVVETTQHIRQQEEKRSALANKRRTLFEELCNMQSQRVTAEMAIGYQKTPITALDLPGGMETARRAVSRAADGALSRSQTAVLQEEATRHANDFERLKGMLSTIDDLAAQTRDRDAPVKQTLARLKAFYGGDAMREFPKERAYVCGSVDRLTNILGNDDAAALREKITAIGKPIMELERRVSEIDKELKGFDERISSLKKELVDRARLELLWEVLPPSLVVRKTDSDGVAVLELDSRKAWTLWAATDEFRWVVEAPPSATWNPQSPVLLSNDNLLTGIYELIFE